MFSSQNLRLDCALKTRLGDIAVACFSEGIIKTTVGQAAFGGFDNIDLLQPVARNRIMPIRDTEIPMHFRQGAVHQSAQSQSLQAEPAHD